MESPTAAASVPAQTVTLIDMTPTEAPASTPVVAKKALMDLSEGERIEWRKTGVKPDAQITPIEEPDEPIAPTPAAAPVSKPVSKRQQQINDYERSIAELKAENARLAQYAMPPTPRQEPPTSATAPTTAAALRPDPLAPPMTEDDFFTKFPEAKYFEYSRYINRYDTAVERHAAHETQQRETAQRGLADAAQTWSGRLAAARQKTPDYDTKAGRFLESVQIGTPIGDAVFHSEVGADLALYFGEHPEDFQRIARLHPNLQLLEVGKLAARFESGAAPSASPFLQHTTSAPEPPTVLGKRPGEPVDAVTGALKRRDTGAYIRAANARDLAAAKG